MQDLSKISLCIYELIKDKEALTANKILGGILANTIGPINDEQWEAMVEDAQVPCETPGCDCEIIRTKVITALDALRNDWKSYQQSKRTRN